jgi:predicted nucleotidyltransferase
VDDRHRKYGSTPILSVLQLQNFFQSYPQVELALLFGSRARGTASAKSDYDLAILFMGQSADPWGHIAVMYSEITSKLNIPEQDIDLVDLARADAAVLSGIQEGYQILKGSRDEIQRILRQDQAKRPGGDRRS